MKMKGSKDGATWERQGPDSCLGGGAVAKSEYRAPRVRRTEGAAILQHRVSKACGTGAEKPTVWRWAPRGRAWLLLGFRNRRSHSTLVD